MLFLKKIVKVIAFKHPPALVGFLFLVENFRKAINGQQVTLTNTEWRRPFLTISNNKGSPKF